MIYVCDLCSFNVLKFKTLAAANRKNGYTHPDDTYKTEKEAWKVIEKCILEDNEYAELWYQEASNNLMHNKAGLQRVRKKLHELKTKRKT